MPLIGQVFPVGMMLLREKIIKGEDMGGAAIADNGIEIIPGGTGGHGGALDGLCQQITGKALCQKLAKIAANKWQGGKLAFIGVKLCKIIYGIMQIKRRLIGDKI